MEVERQLLSVVRRLERMADSATADRTLDGAGRRRALGFVTGIVQVLDEALVHVYLRLQACRYLEAGDVRPDQLAAIKRELDVEADSSSSAEVQHITRRLGELKEQYEQNMRADVGDDDAWRGAEYMLDDRSGQLIQVLGGAVAPLISRLESAAGDEELTAIRRTASEKAEALRHVINALQSFRSRLLGLSDDDGYFQQTEDREERPPVDSTEEPSKGGLTAHISGDISGQVAVGDRISQSTSTSSGLSAREAVQLIEELKGVVAEQEVPDPEKERALRQLEEVRAEAEAGEPSTAYAAATLKKAADTLKEAGVVITEGSRIGKLLVTLAQWVGKNWHWLGI